MRRGCSIKQVLLFNAFDTLSDKGTPLQVGLSQEGVICAFVWLVFGASESSTRVCRARLFESKRVHKGYSMYGAAPSSLCIPGTPPLETCATYGNGRLVYSLPLIKVQRR